MYDVVIIGAGVCGCAIAREMSRLKLNICVLEKEEDVCCGTSKANSGIVHAGFDASPGSLMARLNVEGNLAMTALSQELDFPFQRNGALVLCADQAKWPELERLYHQGVKNGVKGLKIRTKDEVQKMEPNISDEVLGALEAPTGGIVCPFGLTIALAENAAANGVTFHFDTEVKAIRTEAYGFHILVNQFVNQHSETIEQEIQSKYVVNAAGLYADKIHNMVCRDEMKLTPRRGSYFLLDQEVEGLINRTLFQLPGRYGKGVLITRTVHGNILLGPTAVDVEERSAVNTTAIELDEVRKKVRRTAKNIPFHQIITSFAGLRAHEAGHDFIIGEAREVPGFIDCLGIESPGLTSAPAIGKLVAKLIYKQACPEYKENFTAVRKGILRGKDLTKEEVNARIKENPAYGNVVCRCEMVTEGEIVEAIHRPLGAKSLDGVKRRVRAGMGRCQAGFCTPYIMEILARELGISMTDITKSGGTSKLVVGNNE